MSSSVDIDNKKKDVLNLGIGPTQKLNDTTLSTEAQHQINFSRSNRKFCLSLIMEAIVFYSLTLQKYINSKQKTVK